MEVSWILKVLPAPSILARGGRRRRSGDDLRAACQHWKQRAGGRQCWRQDSEPTDSNLPVQDRRSEESKNHDLLEAIGAGGDNAGDAESVSVTTRAMLTTGTTVAHASFFSK